MLSGLLRLAKAAYSLYPSMNPDRMKVFTTLEAESPDQLHAKIKELLDSGKNPAFAKSTAAKLLLEALDLVGDMEAKKIDAVTAHKKLEEIGKKIEKDTGLYLGLMRTQYTKDIQALFSNAVQAFIHVLNEVVTMLDYKTKNLDETITRNLVTLNAHPIIKIPLPNKLVLKDSDELEVTRQAAIKSFATECAKLNQFLLPAADAKATVGVTVTTGTVAAAAIVGATAGATVLVAADTKDAKSSGDGTKVSPPTGNPPAAMATLQSSPKSNEARVGPLASSPSIGSNISALADLVRDTSPVASPVNLKSEMDELKAEHARLKAENELLRRQSQALPDQFSDFCSYLSKDMSFATTLTQVRQRVAADNKVVNEVLAVANGFQSFYGQRLTGAKQPLDQKWMKETSLKIVALKTQVDTQYKKRTQKKSLIAIDTTSGVPHLGNEAEPPRSMTPKARLQEHVPELEVLAIQLLDHVIDCLMAEQRLQTLMLALNVHGNKAVASLVKQLPGTDASSKTKLTLVETAPKSAHATAAAVDQKTVVPAVTTAAAPTAATVVSDQAKLYMSLLFDFVRRDKEFKEMLSKFSIPDPRSVTTVAALAADLKQDLGVEMLTTIKVAASEYDGYFCKRLAGNLPPLDDKAIEAKMEILTKLKQLINLPKQIVAMFGGTVGVPLSFSMMPLDSGQQAVRLLDGAVFYLKSEKAIQEICSHFDISKIKGKDVFLQLMESLGVRYQLERTRVNMLGGVFGLHHYRALGHDAALAGANPAAGRFGMFDSGAAVPQRDTGKYSAAYHSASQHPPKPPAG